MAAVAMEISLREKKWARRNVIFSSAELPLDGWDQIEAHQQRSEKRECDGIDIQ
jgi:hypothetical protein